MRTLKKTLALVLVLAMMFSLCITASADFTDAEEIENAKAVATLVNLGVIDGMGDGTFAPEGTLTRAQAAKIIACLMGVGEYAADGAATGFADVPASHWASGYIAYCVEAGIVDGYGDGNFGPSDELTGYAWTKMLLCALGYDAAAEGFTGSAWQIGVAKKAVLLDLWKGADADNKAALSRDDACLYAYNVLNQDVVKASYLLGEFVGYNDEIGEFDKVNLNVEVVETPVTYDEFGRPVELVEVYSYATKKTVVAYEGAMAPVLTYTAGVKADQVKKDLGLATRDFGKADLGWFEGQEIGKGVLVEVYDMGDANKDKVVEYDVVTVWTEVATIEKEDITEYKAATDKTPEVKASVYLTTITLINEDETEEEFDIVVYTDAYEEGDVLLYNIVWDSAEEEFVAVNVAEAEAVVGKVTSTAAAYIRVDGEKYEYAAGAAQTAKLDNTYTFYLDQYGYIKYVGAAPEAEDVAKTYVYVISTVAKAAGADKNDLYNVTAGEAAAAQAMIMDLETGKVSVVNQGVVYDEDLKGYYYADAKGEASVDEVETQPVTSVMAVKEYVTLADGSYVFADATLTAVSLTEKTAAVGTGLYANSATVVNYVEYTIAEDGTITAAVTSKTGIANFPKTTLTADALVVADKTGIVSEITIVKAAEVETETEVNYAIFNAVGETDAKGTKVSFYVDGELVEYYNVSEATLVKGNVYDITLNAKGQLAGASDVEATASAMTVVAIDATYVLVKDAEGATSTIYFAKDGYKVYDAGASYAAAELAAKDVITVYGAEGADFIVIAADAE